MSNLSNVLSFLSDAHAAQFNDARAAARAAPSHYTHPLARQRRSVSPAALAALIRAFESYARAAELSRAGSAGAWPAVGETVGGSGAKEERLKSWHDMIVEMTLHFDEMRQRVERERGAVTHVDSWDEGRCVAEEDEEEEKTLYCSSSHLSCSTVTCASSPEKQSVDMIIRDEEVDCVSPLVSPCYISPVNCISQVSSPCSPDLCTNNDNGNINDDDDDDDDDDDENVDNGMNVVDDMEMILPRAHTTTTTTAHTCIPSPFPSASPSASSSPMSIPSPSPSPPPPSAPSFCTAAQAPPSTPEAARTCAVNLACFSDTSSTYDSDSDSDEEEYSQQVQCTPTCPSCRAVSLSDDEGDRRGSEDGEQYRRCQSADQTGAEKSGKRGRGKGKGKRQGVKQGGMRGQWSCGCLSFISSDSEEEKEEEGDVF